MALTVRTTPKTSLGDYELLHKIADNSMSTVHKARHQVTGRLVALKTVSRTVAANPVLCRRVEQEFRAARSLEHPHIIRVLDFGMDGAAPYLVMELVEGESLMDRVAREGRLAEERAIPLLLQVAEGLHALHQHHYVHRDVNPDNILVTPAGTALLNDLGQVKFLDAEAALTQGLAVLGTPHFLAPEQMEDPSKVDHRADVYALGATLFMAVTGQLPFQTRSAKNHLRVLEKKLKNDLTPPRKLVPELGEEVEFTIRRAVRADPDQRQHDCQEFIAQLTGRKAAAEPASTRPAWRRKVERRTAVRHAADLQGSCQATARYLESIWPATVCDISTQGLGLRLPRRFEPGSILTVEMHSKDRRTHRALIVRVVRITRQAPDAWNAGCTFLQPLGNDELRELL
jgi:serine/threonine protein kinase